ncbi:MAG: hypothetical protein KKF50_00790 [Nanoarchaeota archaeon]|nr:hypothetical protein [Nanoarchaeota archaeon]
MTNTKYRSESGKIYERREDGWYHNNKKIPKTVFLSSQGAAIQYEMLQNKLLTVEEFFEKDDESERGYLYYIIRKNGKQLIDHSSKLTAIVEDDGTIKLEKE